MITRRDVTVAFICVTTTATLALLAQPSKPAEIHSRVFDWAALKVERTKTGERRNVVDMPTETLTRFECHVTTLEPGEAPHAAHRHLEDELLIIKEGTVESLQEGRTNQVGAGSVIFESSNELHGLRNCGTTRATYYVFKWYPHDLAKTTPKAEK